MLAALHQNREAWIRYLASTTDCVGARTGSPMINRSPSPGDAQDTFISRLIELRDRLLHSIIAVVVVLLRLVREARAACLAQTRKLGIDIAAVQTKTSRRIEAAEQALSGGTGGGEQRAGRAFG